MKLWRGLYLYTLGDLRCFIIVIVHLEPSLAFHSWCKQWRLIKEKPAQSQINRFDHLAVFTTEDAASVWGIFVAGLIACTFMFMYIFGRNIKWIPQRWFTNVCSSLWTVLSVMLTVSHFGPDVVVIVCLYLDREGLIYRVHEWCRGLHAVSTVAELWLIVLHSVLILHPHVSASGQRRRIPMHGSYSDLMGFQCVKDHSTTTQSVVCFLSLHKYGDCFLSFWFYSCYEANWNVISNVTIMRLGAARCHDVTMWNFDFDAYLHPHTACWKQTVLCMFKSNGNMNNLAVTLRFQVYMVEL